MKLSKMQDQTEIGFLDEVAAKLTEEKKTAAVDPKKHKFEIEAAHKLDNSKAIDSFSNKSILSAGGGGIKNDGGSGRYMGSQSNNSIWNSEILQEKLATKDNGEKLKEQNEEIAKLRNGMRQSALDEMAQSISETETRKAASISSTGGTEIAPTSTYHKPQNNISIFDDQSKEAFERLAEKTVGEKSAERARTPKEKDESWRKQNAGTKKMSSLMDSLFDELSK